MEIQLLCSNQIIKCSNQGSGTEIQLAVTCIRGICQNNLPKEDPHHLVPGHETLLLGPVESNSYQLSYMANWLAYVLKLKKIVVKESTEDEYLKPHWMIDCFATK